MIEELAGGDIATNLAVASLLFFLAVYIFVAIRAFRTPAGDLDARARLALDGDRKA